MRTAASPLLPWCHRQSGDRICQPATIHDRNSFWRHETAYTCHGNKSISSWLKRASQKRTVYSSGRHYRRIHSPPLLVSRQCISTPHHVFMVSSYKINRLRSRTFASLCLRKVVCFSAAPFALSDRPRTTLRSLDLYRHLVTVNLVLSFPASLLPTYSLIFSQYTMPVYTQRCIRYFFLLFIVLNKLRSAMAGGSFRLQDFFVDDTFLEFPKFDISFSCMRYFGRFFHIGLSDVHRK